MFGLVLARASQNKLIWFSDAALLFVVEWRQNLKSKMSELSRTKFLGLSVEAALDLRFGGIDAIKDLKRVKKS